MNDASFSIYNASAGSGKTYALVKEYLKIILTSKSNEAYRHILAITFTNKAVGEMKKRVIDCLSAFSSQKTDPKTLQLLQTLEEDTHLTTAQIQEKSKKILKTIIHNYASFDISTIDKFTHRILRSFAFDLELPALFEVSLDTDELLNEAVDLVVADAGSQSELTSLLIEYALEKTDSDKSWDVTKDIFEMSKLLIYENDRNEVDQYKDKSIHEFLTIKQKLIIASKKIQEEIVDLASNALSLIDTNQIEHASFNRGMIPKAFQKWASGTILKYEHLSYLEDETKRYAKSKAQDQKDAIDAIAIQLLDDAQKINDLSEKHLLYDAILKNITPLSLLNTISKRLQHIQKEKNLLSITEFNTIISQQIKDQPAPFIYERLGEKYHHFFIDEFQDTSEIQWQNLIPLIDNALSSEHQTGKRGTLMLVGDPKQSIYRWRGGKAEQFIALAKGENPFVIQDKKCVNLDTNYRSYSEVISFNNQFFKTIASEFAHPDYKDLYENNSFQNTNDKTGGCVTLEFIPYIPPKDQEDESENRNQLYLNATCAKIHEAIKNGFSYGDIVILTRTNKNNSLVANFLIENEIPVLSSDSLLLDTSNEVRAVLDLLKYIQNPLNTMAKAALLYYIAEQRQDIFDKHIFIQKGVKQTDEAVFETWLSEFQIEISFQNLRQKSLYQCVEIGIQQIIPFAKRNAYTHYLCDVLLEFDIRKQASITDFFDFWEKKKHQLSIPSPQNNEAIQILSIHKSKGLEFPVVIIPFADDEIFSRRTRLWVPSGDETIGLDKVLMQKSLKVQGLGEQANLVYNSKHQEELLDAINVLYVGFTRAEEQLHIISCKRTNKDGFSPGYTSYFLGRFIEKTGVFDDQLMAYQWGNPNRISVATPPKTNTQTITYVTPTLHTSKIKIAQREALLWDTKQAESIAYGTVIHEIMAKITTISDSAQAIERAILEGLISSDKQTDIAHKIDQIITHPKLKSFFNPEFTVFNERSILVKNGETIKPDRVVFMPNKQLLLLDYKTGEIEPKHKDQINRYASVLTSMGYTITQKILVYIGADVLIVEG